ncbi:branched-chain amino acid aminotransferase [Xylogone sp. PMI_703]|nr:branched-chain amino acid aminotransferase [Xylogone sp. PMI_703]
MDPYVKVHGLAPGLNYGQQVYEGLKAFRSPSNQINIFRPKKHASRIVHSASFVSIPPIPEEHFLKAVNLAVARNASYVPPSDTDALLYIRPVLFGSGGQLALQPSGEYTFCVYVLPGNSYHGVNALDALVMEEFDRAAPNGTGSAKVGGNYAPVIRWSNKAHKEGYGITLHLDSKSQTNIEEFSTSGFIGLKEEDGDVTIVVPNSTNVIESITSDSCFELAKHLGWKAERREIPFSELSTFSEVLAAGTAAALLPIKSITRRSTNETVTYRNGASEMGPLGCTLRDKIKDIQQGRSEDVFGWTHAVVEA